LNRYRRNFRAVGQRIFHVAKIEAIGNKFAKAQIETRMPLTNVDTELTVVQNYFVKNISRTGEVISLQHPTHILIYSGVQESENYRQ
jgi:hypothetical protein